MDTYHSYHMTHFPIRRGHSLSKTVELPSARGFAECILSDTRQTFNLPSVFNETLGKHIALGKSQFYRVPNIKHSAKYNKTLGKHGHSAKWSHVRWACGGHLTAVGSAALPLELCWVSVRDIRQSLGLPCVFSWHSATWYFCRVFLFDTRQNDVFAECFLLALGKIIIFFLSCPPNFFYSPHTTCGTTC